MPNPKTGMHLCFQDFVLCLQYRRGVQIYNEGTICKVCGKDVNTLGKHASMVLVDIEDTMKSETSSQVCQVISVSLDARNSHLLMTKLDLEGNTRGLAQM